MAECPSYFKVDDKDVLLACGCDTYRRGNDFKNINCSLFIVGHIDFEQGKMDVEFIDEIDKGDCFYAPQFIREIDKPVMIGWLEMWSKNYPTSIWHHGYVGAFSIPRELSIKNEKVYQNPVKQLENYEKVVNHDILPRQADISVTLKKKASLKIKGDNGYILIGNDDRGVYLDNSKGNGMFDCVRHTNEVYEAAKLRILIDTSSIELFVNDGREAISTRFYIDGDLSLVINGENEKLVVKEIGEWK